VPFLSAERALMAEKGINKKQLARKLSRQIKIPPGKVIASRKEKKQKDRKSSRQKTWREIIEEE